MYTSVCIEETIIGRNLSHIYSKYGSHSQSWNDEGHAFDYQVYQWGVEKLFQNSDQSIIRELKLYNKEWRKSNIKNNSQVSKDMFLAKYGSLDIYNEDPEKICIIDHE